MSQQQEYEKRLPLTDIGKIALEHLPVIRELRYRKVLQQAPLKPKYLSNNEFSEKISILKDTVTLLDLIN